eukprot:NODE_616_length_5966_cov_0.249531.p2 type:complete len:354 gc:universal NODE_616_length_5966_cov_0.249531:5258-4197(-)
MSDRAALLEQKKRKLAELRRLRQKRYSGTNMSSTESIQNILESIEVPAVADENVETTEPAAEDTSIKSPIVLSVAKFKHFEMIINNVKYDKSTQIEPEVEDIQDIEMLSLSDNESRLSEDVQQVLEVENKSEIIPLNDFVVEAAKKIELMMSIHATTKHVYIYDQIELKQSFVISCQFYRNDIVLTTESGVHFRSSSILVENTTASLCHDLIYIGTEYGQIHIIDPRTNKEINLLDRHKYPVKQISHNSNTLSTLSEDGELLLWNIKMINEPIASISTKPGALCLVKMHQYIVGCLYGMYSITMQMNNRPLINDAKFKVDSVYLMTCLNEFALTASIDHVSLWHIPVIYANLD